MFFLFELATWIWFFWYAIFICHLKVSLQNQMPLPKNCTFFVTTINCWWIQKFLRFTLKYFCFFFFQFCQKADNCSKNEKNVLTFKHFVMHSQRCLFLLAGIYHWKWLVKHTAYYWDNLGFLSDICICMHSWFRRFILYVPDTKRCWTCVVTAEFKKSA